MYNNDDELLLASLLFEDHMFESYEHVLAHIIWRLQNGEESRA